MSKCSFYKKYNKTFGSNQITGSNQKRNGATAEYTCCTNPEASSEPFHADMIEEFSFSSAPLNCNGDIDKCPLKNKPKG